MRDMAWGKCVCVCVGGVGGVTEPYPAIDESCVFLTSKLEFVCFVLFFFGGFFEILTKKGIFLSLLASKHNLKQSGCFDFVQKYYSIL